MPPQKRKGDSGLDPVIDDREKGRVESARERSRAASAKYYATHPEVRERRRIQTAQRRAAKKAHKRQWDPPKKTRSDTQDEAVASGNVLATESSQAPATSPEVHSTQDELVDSDVAFHTAAPAETPSQSSSMGRPKRKIPHKLGGSDAAASHTAAPAQNLSLSSIGRPKRKSEVHRIQKSLDDDVSDPDVGEDSTRASTPEDEEYHPSLERAEKQRAQHRKAVAKYYASHPEVREKREIQAVERRAKNAYRRQRDPLKKPKSNTHVAASSAPPTEVSHASTTGLHDIQHELEDSDIDNTASTATPAEDLLQSPTSRPKRKCKVLRAAAPAEELSQSSTGRPKRKIKVNQMQELGKPGDAMDLDVASGGNEYDPGPELERGEQAKAQRRRSSRKYYASHPEVKEKKRVYMAEKRAAIKARRRQWDPPKKPKSSIHVAPSSAPPTKVARASTSGLDDMQPELADSDHAASTAAPAENLSQSATGRPKRKLKVHRMQEQAFYDSDVASNAHHATDLLVTPGDEEYNPGTELERGEQAKAQRRRSSRKYYASHPEVKEKKRVYMAEKRAAIKARRRQWDPPKKPKATTQAEPPISSAAAEHLSGMTQVGSSGEGNWELMSHEGSDAEDVVVGGNTALTGVYCWNV